MYWILLFIMIMMASILEVVLANCHVVMPLLPSAAFYIGSVSAWNLNLLPLLLGASLIDALMVRNFPVESVTVICVLVLANQWRRWADIYSPFAVWVAGPIIGIISCGTLLLDRYFDNLPSSEGLWKLMLIWLAISGLITIVVCWLANWLAEFLGVKGLMRVHASADMELEPLPTGDDNEI